MGQKANIQPQLPIVNQNLLREDHNSQEYHQEALRQAQIKAMNTKNTELEFARQLQETRLALEKEIHKQLVEQLTLRAQKKSVTPEQQALIEKLYLDLRLINPELALATLKASASLDASPPSPQYSHNHHQQQQHSRSRQVQQREEEARHHYHHQHQERVQSSRVSKGPPQLVHNQGSIVNSHDEPSSVPSKSSKSSKSKSSSRR